jgi:hypothetical protein
MDYLDFNGCGSNIVSKEDYCVNTGVKLKYHNRTNMGVIVENQITSPFTGEKLQHAYYTFGKQTIHANYMGNTQKYSVRVRVDLFFSQASYNNSGAPFSRRTVAIEVDKTDALVTEMLGELYGAFIEQGQDDTDAEGKVTGRTLDTFTDPFSKQQLANQVYATFDKTNFTARFVSSAASPYCEVTGTVNYYYDKNHVDKKPLHSQTVRAQVAPNNPSILNFVVSLYQPIITEYTVTETNENDEEVVVYTPSLVSEV